MPEYYVAVGGSALNPGTIEQPWDLAHAFTGAGSIIIPGDTIWLRGGLYTRGAHWSMNTVGTLGIDVDDAATKIKWRNYPGERVQITTTDAAQEVIQVNGKYNWLWATLGRDEGIEVFRSVPTRDASRGTNIWFAGPTPLDGNKVIHVVTRDGSNGILNGGFDGTYNYGDLEIYGVLAYNNGQEQPGQRTHAMYLRSTSASPGRIRVSKCIAFNQLGYGLHFWSELATGLKNMQATDNIIWGSGRLGSLGTSVFANILLAAAQGIGSPVQAGVIQRNILYQPSQDDASSSQLILGGLSDTVNEDCICTDNYIVGGDRDTTFATVRVFLWRAGAPNLTFERNEIIPMGTGNILENAQAGSLATYTSWINNKFYTLSTLTAWRQVSTNKTFATWKTDTGLGASDTADVAQPVANKVFVIPATKYNAKYGHACYFNWSLGTGVNVDLSTILAVGDHYEVYNAQDIFGEPILTGTYVGGLVVFPVTGVNAPIPVGVTPRPPLSTAPFFDAFFVRAVPAAADSAAASAAAAGMTVRRIVLNARDEHHNFTRERHSNRALVDFLSERHRTYYKELADDLKDRLSVEVDLTADADGNYALPADSLQIVAIWATLTTLEQRIPVTWMPVGNKAMIPTGAGPLATVTGFTLKPLINPNDMASLWDSVASVTVTYIPEPPQFDTTAAETIDQVLSIPSVYGHVLKWELAAFMARRERGKDPNFPESLLRFYNDEAKQAAERARPGVPFDHRVVKTHRTRRNR
jgi:hypothetical protein